MMSLPYIHAIHGFKTAIASVLAHVDHIINFGLSRVSEICIGILCAFAVSVLIFPRRKIDVKLLNLRKEGLIKRFDSKRLVQVFSFYSSLLYYAEDIIKGKKNLQAKP